MAVAMSFSHKIELNRAFFSNKYACSNPDETCFSSLKVSVVDVISIIKLEEWELHQDNLCYVSTQNQDSGGTKQLAWKKDCRYDQ